jgi:hypothetical protein
VFRVKGLLPNMGICSQKIMKSQPLTTGSNIDHMTASHDIPHDSSHDISHDRSYDSSHDRSYDSSHDMSHDRNRNDGSCCHHFREAVFRVQGPYLNIENTQKSRKKLLQNQEKIKKNINSIDHCYDDEGAVSRVRVHV